MHKHTNTLDLHIHTPLPILIVRMTHQNWFATIKSRAHESSNSDLFVSLFKNRYFPQIFKYGKFKQQRKANNRLSLTKIHW